MSKLREMVASRPPGKRCVIWKKTHTSRNASALRRYIEEYLDETGKKDTTKGGGLAAPTIPVKHSSLRHGIDYLTKKEKGDVHVFGFLRHEIETETGRLANTLTNSEKAGAAETVWRRLLKKKGLKKVVHKIVVALDPEVCEMMTLARVPVDEELLRLVREGLGQYEQKFYQGHKLGYLVGIHHDRRHIHAHIMLFPQTDRGKPINVSHDSKVTLKDGFSIRVDYQGFLKSTFEKMAKEMYETKIRRPLNPLPLPIEYNVHPKLLTWQALQKPGATQFQAAEAIRRQQDAPQNRPQTAANLRAAFEQRQEDFDRIPPADAGARLKAKRKERRNLLDLMAVKARNLRRGNGSSDLMAVKHQLYGDVFRVRKIFCGSRRVAWSLADFSADSEGSWYLERMKKGDRLGAFMRDAFSKIESVSKSVNVAEQVREIARLSSRPKRSGFVPDFVPETWRRKRAVIDDQLNGLKIVQRVRLAEIEKDLARQRAVREKEVETLKHAKMKLDVLDLEIADLTAKAASKTPLYLAKFKLDRDRGKPPIPCLSGSGHRLSPKDRQDGSLPDQELEPFVTPDQSDATPLGPLVEETLRLLQDPPRPVSSLLATPIPQSESPDQTRLRMLLARNLPYIKAMTSAAASTPLGAIFPPIKDEEELDGIDI